MRYAALPYLIDFEAGRSFRETQKLQRNAQVRIAA